MLIKSHCDAIFLVVAEHSWQLIFIDKHNFAVIIREHISYSTIFNYTIHGMYTKVDQFPLSCGKDRTRPSCSLGLFFMMSNVGYNDFRAEGNGNLQINTKI